MVDNNPAHEDALINFMFSGLPVRGVLLQLSGQWRELTSLHDYQDPVRDLLGQSLSASAMIASTLKFEGMLTLQLAGTGSLGMLIAQCNDQLQIRGMAGDVEASLPGGNFAELIGDGRLTLTVDAKDAKDRYQGIVAADGATLAEALAGYYRDSAQLDAHFVLLTDEHHAAALMLQRMPDEREMALDDWRRLCLMADTLTLQELREGAGNDMLAKLFAEDDVVVYGARPVRFYCRCSIERAEQAVRMLGEADAQKLLIERNNLIEVICEFCNKKRTLDAVDVGRLFNPAGVRSDAGVH